MKEFDDERKFPTQIQLIAPALVKLPGDIMRFKAQSITHLAETSEAVAPVAIFAAALIQTNLRYRECPVS